MLFTFAPLRASLTRPAPGELPQVRNEARVTGRSGAMYVACPYFFPLVTSYNCELAVEN